MLKNYLNTSANERVFVRQALSTSGIRLDGRGVEDFRGISLTVNRSETNSVCEARIGNTLIVAIVTGEIVAPFPDRPNEGSLHFNTEISPHTETLGVTHSQISRVLERCIRDSQTLDVESLCIVSGAKVWEIRCEVRVVDATGGNILDTCVLAAMGALKGFRKPEISVVSNSVKDKDAVQALVVHHSDEREPLPLALHHTPLSVTLGVLRRTATAVDTNGEGYSGPDSYIFIVDPSSEEDGAMDGSISFSLNAFRELCAVSKPGGISLSVSAIMQAAHICLRKVTYLHQRLTEALALLEEQVLKKREERQDTLRTYNALVGQRKAAGVLDDMDIDEDNAAAAVSAGGIDRNHPILQWGNLHQPVASKSEAEMPSKKKRTKK